MGFRGGAEGGAEGGLRVIARRKPLERIVERAGEFREGKGWCTYTFVYFSGYTIEKIIRGSVRDRDHGGE